MLGTIKSVVKGFFHTAPHLSLMSSTSPPDGVKPLFESWIWARNGVCGRCLPHLGIFLCICHFAWIVKHAVGQFL